MPVISNHVRLLTVTGEGIQLQAGREYPAHIGWFIKMGVEHNSARMTQQCHRHHQIMVCPGLDIAIRRTGVKRYGIIVNPYCGDKLGPGQGDNKRWDKGSKNNRCICQRMITTEGVMSMVMVVGFGILTNQSGGHCCFRNKGRSALPVSPGCRRV